MDFEEQKQPTAPDKKPVDQQLKAEFERVLAEHKKAMTEQKANLNEHLARITSEGLTNEDMELFLKIVTNRVGLIAEFDRYRDDMALKHPLLAEVRQMKKSMEKEIGVSHVEQEKGDNRFELYSYLSHLLGIAKLEADKNIKMGLRGREEDGGFLNETKDDDWGDILN